MIRSKQIDKQEFHGGCTGLGGDTLKKTWIKISAIYILNLNLLPFVLNYSFLYTNEKTASILEWIDPAYSVQFLVIGLIGCVCLCKQTLREFSKNIFNFESLIILLVNVSFIFFVMFVGKAIGQYEINWIGVLNCSLFCYVFVAFTEEWIYRGFIVTQMKKIFKSDLTIIIISAVLFALSHLPAYFLNTENITLGGAIYRVLIPLLLGLVYACIFLCNGNLLVLVILHGTYNFIENIAFDSWYYVSYGICWLLVIGYVVYCYRRMKGKVKM